MALSKAIVHTAMSAVSLASLSAHQSDALMLTLKPFFKKAEKKGKDSAVAGPSRGLLSRLSTSPAAASAADFVPRDMPAATRQPSGLSRFRMPSKSKLPPVPSREASDKPAIVHDDLSQAESPTDSWEEPVSEKLPFPRIERNEWSQAVAQAWGEGKKISSMKDEIYSNEAESNRWKADAEQASENRRKAHWDNNSAREKFYSAFDQASTSNQDIHGLTKAWRDVQKLASVMVPAAELLLEKARNERDEWTKVHNKVYYWNSAMVTKYGSDSYKIPFWAQNLLQEAETRTSFASDAISSADVWVIDARAAVTDSESTVTKYEEAAAAQSVADDEEPDRFERGADPVAMAAALRKFELQAEAHKREEAEREARAAQSGPYRTPTYIGSERSLYVTRNWDD